jgi:CRP/FNR family transcriptional regulator
MTPTIAPSKPVACPHNTKVSCSNCRLSSLCLPLSLEVEELDQINDVILRDRPLHKGDYLYRASDKFHSIYAVRAGCLKTIKISEDGEEQITGFYLPGEIIGIDGLSDNHYSTSAIALETSAICEIPFHKLEELSHVIPSLQRHFFQIMSKEIIADQELIMLLSKGSAEQRLAALLLSLSARYQRRQLSATAFVLPMSRTEMGNYLGLTIETVSRVMGRFQKQGLTESDRRSITLLDVDALRKIANTPH